MPALANPRHERFAQETAKGASPAEACRAAGYRPAERFAGQAGRRLRARPEIKARVAEIQERAAVRAEVTLADLTQALLRIAAQAETLGGASGFAAARAALMDIARLHGLAAERSKGEGGGRTHEDALAELDGEPAR